MKLKHCISLFTIVIGLAGCSAHNPFIIKNTTDVNQFEASRYPSHRNRVLVTSANLPETVKYEVLGTLEVGKVWYGSSNDVLQSLADGARQLGADAVVEVRTWHQPSGWSWAAPHGSGIAVKITEPGEFKLSSIGGDWR